MQREAPSEVRVDPGYRGGWQVSFPDGRPIVCDTLDDARREAQRFAGRSHPCELVIRDAYHRVIDRKSMA